PRWRQNSAPALVIDTGGAVQSRPGLIRGRPRPVQPFLNDWALIVVAVNGKRSVWGACFRCHHRVAQAAAARMRSFTRRAGSSPLLLFRAGLLMPVTPILEEDSGSRAGSLLSSLAGFRPETADPAVSEVIESQRPRTLAIYPASAGFDLVEELDHLCARSVEPNIFFNPRFLAPAMPRLEDKEIRLAVIRDGGPGQGRLRLLVPFSIERPPVPFGVPIMRTWANPFGPLGTPLVDHDDPEGVISDFFSMLARPHLKLPRVFVLPEVRLDGPFATILSAFAASRNLTLVVTGQAERPYLQSTLEGEDYLREALRSHHLRELRRLR